MARPRFHRAPAKLKEALLTAAAKEFSANGYEAAAINQILESAGLSKGAFYYYFDDKADLAATVLQHAFSDYLRALAALEVPKKGEDFWQAINDFGRIWVANFKRSPENVELLSRIGAAMVRDAHLSYHIEPILREAMVSIKALWRAGQKLGVVRRDISLELFWALVEGINVALYRVWVPKDRPMSAGDLARLVQIKLDLLYRIAHKEAASAPGGGLAAKRRRSRSPLKETPS
jgi:AcrR family transcriptional regulator